MKPNKFENVQHIIFSTTIVIIGVITSILGIKSEINYKREVKDFISTKGIYIEKILVSKNTEEESFKLLYKYYSHGIEYRVSTTYEVSENMLPEVGSTKTVMYNPAKPTEAIIKNAFNQYVLMFCGTFFILGGIYFLLIKLKKGTKIVRGMLETVFGVLFISVFYDMQNYTSFWEMVESLNILLLIPVFFIIEGLANIFRKKIDLEKDIEIIIKDEKLNKSKKIKAEKKSLYKEVFEYSPKSYKYSFFIPLFKLVAALFILGPISQEIENFQNNIPPIVLLIGIETLIFLIFNVIILTLLLIKITNSEDSDEKIVDVINILTVYSYYLRIMMYLCFIIFWTIGAFSTSINLLISITSLNAGPLLLNLFIILLLWSSVLVMLIIFFKKIIKNFHYLKL